MKIKKKIIFIILLLILFSIIGIIAAYLYKNRNTRTVYPVSEISTENAVCFYQKDDNWKDDPLGDSKYHMGDSGCLTTCIASELLMQNITINEIPEITPETLNRYFSENNVYDSEGNLQWEAAGSVLNVTFLGREASDTSGEELEKMLKSNIYPIVCVKRPSSGNYHFVLLAGADKNSFLCMDPLDKSGNIIPLSDYDDKIYSVRYCEQTTENEITAAEEIYEQTTENEITAAEEIYEQTTENEITVTEEIVEEEKYYKLVKSSASYYYEIYDENGVTIEKSKKYPKPPKLSMSNEHLVKCTYQTGTGLSTQWGFYYDTERDVLSRKFIGGIYDEYEDKMIFRGEKYKLIVRNIFDKTDYYYYYYEISTFKYPLAKTTEPFRKAEFIDGGSKIEVTYLTGENYEEVTEIIDLV